MRIGDRAFFDASMEVARTGCDADMADMQRYRPRFNSVTTSCPKTAQPVVAPS